MALGPPPVKEPIIFHQNMPPFLNLAAPPPPPPPDFDGTHVNQLSRPQTFDRPEVSEEKPQFEG